MCAVNRYSSAARCVSGRHQPRSCCSCTIQTRQLLHRRSMLLLLHSFFASALRQWLQCLICLTPAAAADAAAVRGFGCSCSILNINKPAAHPCRSTLQTPGPGVLTASSQARHNGHQQQSLLPLAGTESLACLQVLSWPAQRHRQHSTHSSSSLLLGPPAFARAAAQPFAGVVHPVESTAAAYSCLQLCRCCRAPEQARRQALSTKAARQAQQSDHT